MRAAEVVFADKIVGIFIRNDTSLSENVVSCNSWLIETIECCVFNISCSRAMIWLILNVQLKISNYRMFARTSGNHTIYQSSISSAFFFFFGLGHIYPFIMQVFFLKKKNHVVKSCVLRRT